MATIPTIDNHKIQKVSAAAVRAGMTEEQWRTAIKFNGTDVGWVIMSIGMAIGAGIVFLPALDTRENEPLCKNCTWL